MDLSDAQALFAREYSALFDDIYRYVASRLFNRDDAQDIVSESFTKAYARLAEFDPNKGNLKQWVSGIAKYELLMHWRRAKYLFPLEEEELSSVVSSETQEGSLDQSIDQQALAEKMYRQLPPAHKVLLTLRYVDDLSYEELSEVTGKEPAALRQFFSRLHRTLRLAFQDQYDIA